jgi:hypothetical protein
MKRSKVIKLSIYLIKHHATKTYRKWRYRSVLTIGKWSVAHPYCFIAGETDLGAHCWGWERKDLFSQPGIEPWLVGRPSCNLVPISTELPLDEAEVKTGKYACSLHSVLITLRTGFCFWCIRKLVSTHSDVGLGGGCSCKARTNFSV